MTDRYNMQETPESSDPADNYVERDEASAAHLRSTPSAHPPRFFRNEDGTEWEWRNGLMTVEFGSSSIFTSPDDLLDYLDVIEVDEHGNPLADDADDIAGDRGDREGKLQREEDA